MAPGDLVEDMGYSWSILVTTRQASKEKILSDGRASWLHDATQRSFCQFVCN
jgi:hypothetical protein